MQKQRKTLVIAFMGVDGSGKSTLIKELNKKLNKNYKKVKNLHLRPYLFLTDRRTVISNPHSQKTPKSKIISFLQILIWLFIYRFFFLINLNKKNQLIIFDRYAHDLLFDKTRYRFNLSNKLTQCILNFFPKPDLWIILKAPINLIEKRKKELKTKELKRQMKMYIKFSKKKKNIILLDTSSSIKKNISLIIKEMKSIVKSNFF
jgi:thymidylate kinase